MCLYIDEDFDPITEHVSSITYRHSCVVVAALFKLLESYIVDGGFVENIQNHLWKFLVYKHILWKNNYHYCYFYCYKVIQSSVPLKNWSYLQR